MSLPANWQQLEAAHGRCIVNEAELRASELCGCFHCLANYAPAAIENWIDDRLADGRSGRTALCPECGIDSVLGSASGYPMTPEFLKAMHDKYF